MKKTSNYPTDPSTTRSQRFHGKIYQIKPENLTRVKRTQRKNKRYYKWMGDETPRTAKRHPQLNKRLRRKPKSEFILMAERVEWMAARALFEPKDTRV